MNSYRLPFGQFYLPFGQFSSRRGERGLRELDPPTPRKGAAFESNSRVGGRSVGARGLSWPCGSVSAAISEALTAYA